MSPLLWTSKSTRNLTAALAQGGHQVSHMRVAPLLRELGYSLQANRKTREGKEHPDRDAQFRYINQRVRSFQRRKQPVIPVDTKKRELVETVPTLLGIGSDMVSDFGYFSRAIVVKEDD